MSFPQRLRFWTLSFWRRRSVWIVLGLLMAIAAWRFWPQKPPPFVISRATTHFVEPLDAEGNVDFRAIIDRLMRADIPHEKNAAVVLAKNIWQVESIDARLYWQLGLEMPRKPDGMLMEFATWIERTKVDVSRYQREDWANTPRQISHWIRPRTGESWREKEYPLFARWLREMEPAIERCIAGLSREWFYLPGLPAWDDEKRVFSSRLLTEALEYRFHRSLVVGDLQLARRDLHALIRHALLDDVPMFRRFDAYPHCRKLELQYVLHRKITQTDLLAYVDERKALPLRPSAREVALARATWCVTLQDIRHGRLKVSELSEFRHGNSIYKTLIAQPDQFDFNIICRQFHKSLDLFEKSEAATTFAARRKAEKKLLAFGIACFHRAREYERNEWKHVIFGTTVAERSQWAADCLTERDPEVWGNVDEVLDPSAHNEAYERLITVSIALQRYRFDRGEFPNRLDDLVPKYLPVVPLDDFTEKPLIYKPRPGGFRLYSVGHNGKDENGGFQDNGKHNPAIDDPVAAFPHPGY